MITVVEFKGRVLELRKVIFILLFIHFAEAKRSDLCDHIVDREEFLSIVTVCGKDLYV